MKLSKEEIIKKYIQDLRNRVGNFDLKVQTSAILNNFFRVKGYDFYFGPRLAQQDNGRPIKTPDFQAHKEQKNDIIGEIKQGLPNPNSENYDKKVAKNLEQLESYNGNLVGISTPHDVFFSAPSWCNEAIAYFIKEISANSALKNKVIVLKYGWLRGNNHSQLSISKIYGNFSDSDINQEFLYKDYLVGEGDLEQIQGYYKILYTEEQYNDTPIEYIMLVLWHNVFPELIKTAEFDKTMERIKVGKNSLRFKVEEILEIIDKMYTLKTASNQTGKQFSKEMVVDALESFVKINKAQKLNDSGTNPEFVITHSKISSSKDDLITYLIKELRMEEFEKKAEIEYQKQLHKNLEEINS
ncbi:hypothetical protein HYY74_04550 [Candidatus Woesearchaeota archaeon]|nr:hypothetical protein [Candidatus Woesearchaeota archaeon]